MGLKGLILIAIGLAACSLAVIPNLPQSTPTKPAPAPQEQQRIAASGLPLEKIKFGGEEFDLEVAATEPAVRKGLSERSEISATGGMVFVYPLRTTLDFWMRNCLVDIDIAFIDDTGTVTAVYTMPREAPRAAAESEASYEARLPRYVSNAPVRFAIETKAGTNARLGIKIGSKVPIDVRKLSAYSR